MDDDVVQRLRAYGDHAFDTEQLQVEALMNDAIDEIEGLRAALRDVMGYVEVEDFSAHSVEECRKSMEAARELLPDQPSESP